MHNYLERTWNTISGSRIKHIIAFCLLLIREEIVRLTTSVLEFGVCRRVNGISAHSFLQAACRCDCGIQGIKAVILVRGSHWIKFLDQAATQRYPLRRRPEDFFSMNRSTKFRSLVSARTVVVARTLVSSYQCGSVYQPRR